MITAPYQKSRTVEGAVQDQLFLLTLQQLDLLPVWEYVRDHNPTGNLLPFHNNYHMFQVARIANDLLRYYDNTEQRTLITGGLFHDFGHSGGEFKDDVNIQRALDGFDTFVGKQLLVDIEIPLEAQKDIWDLIKVTEFPFIHEPASILAKCLRDADLLFGLADDSIPLIIDGLRSEMEVAEQVPITATEMAERQTRFYMGVKMYTPPGQLLWDQLSQETLAKQIRYAKRGLV